MREVTVLNGQTIFDIAIQSCGNVESAYDIALLNDIDVFSYPQPGTTLNVPDVVNKQVIKMFEQDKPTSKVVQDAPTQITKTDISYSDLLFLRNNGILQAGHFYCITDYVATTVQRKTRASKHRFNVIVQAVTNYELSETAKVCAIDGDDYFDKNKLNAWEIKYCLDNDTSRFAWADAVNGKGVIYHMCDENGNSAPYDFKNILFGDNYTFELSGEDFSLNGTYCRNNVIRPYVVNGVQMLNGNLCNNLYEGECSGNFFDYNCHDNYLVDNCFNNSFGEGCYGNTLYYNCYNNVFGISCNNNILEDSCANNVFMSGCGNNTFGILCSDNYLSQSCRGNEFKRGSSRNYLEPYCRYNTLGNGSSNNRFSSRCENNTLGDNAIGNTFGAGCQNNTLGKYCQYNSYGNYCMNISFRGRPDLTTSVVEYVQNCHVSDGCSYLVIHTRPRSTAILKNVMVKGGVSGTSSEYQCITVLEYNAEYEIMVARNTSGEIITYCEADLVQ